MVNYNPRSIDQMYEQYSKTHSSKSDNANKTFAESMKAGGGGRNMSGAGSSAMEGLMKSQREETQKDSDNKVDKNEGVLGNFFSKFFGAAEANGLEFVKPDKPKPSIYDRDDMKPIDIDAQIKRINDRTNFDLADPMRYRDDEYADSTYDEVKDQNIPQNSVVDIVNTAIENTIPTGAYTVKKGDTLSEIAQATGRTVKELQQLNNIKDPRKMQAGSSLKIPVQTAQDKEIVEGATKMSDLKPIRAMSQSMMSEDQRKFAPELGYDEIALPSEATVDKKIKGLGARPDVTVTELDPPSDTANVNNPQTRDGISFISTDAIDNLYTEIGALETTTAHLGDADFEDVGITLGYGIVPTSGLKYEHNGTVIELPDEEAERWTTLSAAGVTEDNFDPDNVITDDVVKDGIRRDYYDSDESFTKAVMKKFQDRVETAAERQDVDADDIPEGAMTGLVGYSYNTGDSHDYNDMEPVYEELTKGADANMTTVQDGMLQTFTTGGIVKQGMANRRRTDYNHVAEALGQPTITHKTNRLLPNGNAGFEFEFSDGTTRTFDSGKRYDTETSQADFKDDLNVKQAVN